jgi:hypothetical protein
MVLFTSLMYFHRIAWFSTWLGVWNSVLSDPGIGSEGPSTDHELIIIWLIICSLDAFEKLRLFVACIFIVMNR